MLEASSEHQLLEVHLPKSSIVWSLRYWRTITPDLEMYLGTGQVQIVRNVNGNVEYSIFWARFCSLVDIQPKRHDSTNGAPC